MDTIEQKFERIKAGMETSIHQAAASGGSVALNTASIVAQLGTITIVLLEILKELSVQTETLQILAGRE